MLVTFLVIATAYCTASNPGLFNAVLLIHEYTWYITYIGIFFNSPTLPTGGPPTKCSAYEVVHYQATTDHPSTRATERVQLAVLANR